ncbi:DNA binding protein [Octadecabacter Antarctic DB virus 2]|nr:DNA binding protein [Octadecabacter Antarctic DB virus 2]
MTKRANDFLIWRAGASVDWDCTASEIASETGLGIDTIWKTCKRRGWVLPHGHLGNVYASRHATDTLMKSPYIAKRHET